MNWRQLRYFVGVVEAGNMTLAAEQRHVAQTAEAMSHVLIDTLARGKVHFILCYDVPDPPQFSRTALMQDDLVLITPPRAANGKPIAFVDALEERRRGQSVAERQ